MTFKQSIKDAIDKYEHDWDVHVPHIVVELRVLEVREHYDLCESVLQNPDNHFDHVIVEECFSNDETDYRELDLPSVYDAEPYEQTITKYRRSNG